MARRPIGTLWDRHTRNDINDNFKELYEGVVSEISEDVQDLMDSFTEEGEKWEV